MFNIYRIETSDPEFYFSVECETIREALDKAEGRLSAYNEISMKVFTDKKLVIRSIIFRYSQSK